MFMFNKTIVLFHHFFTQVETIYSYYPEGKIVRKFENRTAASFYEYDSLVL
jgi:hypothetical protein